MKINGNTKMEDIRCGKMFSDRNGGEIDEQSDILAKNK